MTSIFIYVKVLATLTESPNAHLCSADNLVCLLFGVQQGPECGFNKALMAENAVAAINPEVDEGEGCIKQNQSNKRNTCVLKCYIG